MKIFTLQKDFLTTFSMFDAVFAQFGVISRIRNKFVEIVATAERYFIIAHVKNKESKKQPF